MLSDSLFLFFKNKFPFKTDGLMDFIDSFQTKTYPKGTIILQANADEQDLRFLDEGIIREFYAYKDKERNLTFYTQPEFITDFNALVQKTPTKKYQECLSDSTLRVLPREKFSFFLHHYPCGKMFIETIFKQLMAQKEQEEFKNYCLSPDELYLDLLATKPEWLQLIPQYHLASYLGLTPETLSRIRKRITS
jgi:CRP-like cAMP-binding protein